MARGDPKGSLPPVPGEIRSSSKVMRKACSHYTANSARDAQGPAQGCVPTIEGQLLEGGNSGGNDSGRVMRAKPGKMPRTRPTHSGCRIKFVLHATCPPALVAVLRYSPVLLGICMVELGVGKKVTLLVEGVGAACPSSIADAGAKNRLGGVV